KARALSSTTPMRPAPAAAAARFPSDPRESSVHGKRVNQFDRLLDAADGLNHQLLRQRILQRHTVDLLAQIAAVAHIQIPEHIPADLRFGAAILRGGRADRKARDTELLRQLGGLLLTAG